MSKGNIKALVALLFGLAVGVGAGVYLKREINEERHFYRGHRKGYNLGRNELIMEYESEIEWKDRALKGLEEQAEALMRRVEELGGVRER